MTHARPNGKIAHRFWQRGGGHDRNLFTPEAVRAGIDYVHLNPVRRGLCERPADWRWSSAADYAARDRGTERAGPPLSIDFASPPTEAPRVRRRPAGAGGRHAADVRRFCHRGRHEPVSETGFRAGRDAGEFPRTPKTGSPAARAGPAAGAGRSRRRAGRRGAPGPNRAGFRTTRPGRSGARPLGDGTGDPHQTVRLSGPMTFSFTSLRANCCRPASTPTFSRPPVFSSTGRPLEHGSAEHLFEFGRRPAGAGTGRGVRAGSGRTRGH